MSESDTDIDNVAVGQPSNKKRKYSHKFREEWKTTYSWIGVSKKGAHYFSCKVCASDYLAGISAVRKHENSNKHKSNCKLMKSQVSVLQMPAVSLFKTKEKQLKTSELRLASFVAEHNISFNVVDHLINIVRDLPSDSALLKDMSCNRTKCTALVKNVLGKEGFQNQIMMMKEKHFSIIIDESTDVASIKSLAICVRYVVNCRSKDYFLHLLPVPEANATTLHSTLITFFHEHEIDYKSKMVGFAADGASVMMGHHHSVQALLKRDIPDLWVFKCICHSLAICASQACTKLPRTPETLLREIYSYFKYSYKKVSQFKEFQEFVEARPHKMLHPSQTRWLSLYSSIKRILEQYNALILFFRMAAFEEKNQQAEHIFEKLTDPSIKLTFQFLKFVLPLFCDLNLLFQAEAFQLHNIYQSMYTTYFTILEFFIKPNLIKVDPLGLNYNDPQNYLPLDEIYLGGEVTAVLIDSTCNMNTESLVVFKTNCLHFYIEALNQINKRFPFDSEFCKGLKELGFLNPANISGTKTIAAAASYFKNFVTDINVLDKEFRLLRNQTDLDFSLSVEEFWGKVSTLKTANETPLYPNIIQFVSGLMTLPHSSASVERLFSAVNLNKTKQRNRLSTETITSILHTKQLIKEGGKSCFNYNISESILAKFNNSIY